MDPISALIALAIATLFVLPALRWPALGRWLVSLMFLGGAAFNAFYTLPNLPASLEALVATAFLPVYRDVVERALSLNGAAFAALVIAFELAVGVCILSGGRATRLGLLAAAAWSIGMLPVIPPDGILIGIALTGAPGIAALILLRGRAAPAGGRRFAAARQPA